MIKLQLFWPLSVQLGNKGCNGSLILGFRLDQGSRKCLRLDPDWVIAAYTPKALWKWDFTKIIISQCQLNLTKSAVDQVLSISYLFKTILDFDFERHRSARDYEQSQAQMNGDTTHCTDKLKSVRDDSNSSITKHNALYSKSLHDALILFSQRTCR